MRVITRVLGKLCEKLVDEVTFKGSWGFRAVAAAIVATYLALLYGVYVPDWDFIPPTVLNSTALHVSVVRVNGSMSEVDQLVVLDHIEHD